MENAVILNDTTTHPSRQTNLTMQRARQAWQRPIGHLRPRGDIYNRRGGSTSAEGAVPVMHKLDQQKALEKKHKGKDEALVQFAKPR